MLVDKETKQLYPRISNYIARSRSLDVSDINWEEVQQYPLHPQGVRVLQYMQDVESHTIVFPSTVFSTRAVRDPEIGPFQACWLYEEMFHGFALKRFLEAADQPCIEAPGGRVTFSDRVNSVATSLLSGFWPGFLALYMTWGAINELTTLTSYNRVSLLAGHPVLEDLLKRIVRDESRHFSFYYHKAEQLLADSTTARLTRFWVDRLWSPVGAGVRPKPEMIFVAGYLFSGTEGQQAARKIDATIRRLPGFHDVQLFEAWVAQHVNSDELGWEKSAKAA
jgi:hypothetical protein